MQNGDYGIVRYFQSVRCFNDEQLRKFNKDKISAPEIVSFDSALMQMQEIPAEKVVMPADKSQQILAIIVRPEIEPNCISENDKRFEFAGYDLVEAGTGISAITNCGGEFDQAINYDALNIYGVFPTYREAVLTQLDLYECYPEENHAYCYHRSMALYHRMNIQLKIHLGSRKLWSVKANWTTLDLHGGKHGKKTRT